MSVVIMGAGAMGGIFGAAVSASGVPTFMIDVSVPVVERLRRDGVTITRDGQEHVTKVNAATDPTGIDVADVVFFFVKCYHTSSAAEAIAPMVSEQTVIVSLQNGWGNGDVLSGHFDPNRTVVGVTYHSGTVLEAGRVAHTGSGPTFVGPYNPDGQQATHAVGDLLSAAGQEVTVTEKVREEIWKKLVLNAATLPAAALTRLSSGELGRPGPMLDLVDLAAAETVAVGRAAGYELNLEERVRRIHAVPSGAGEGKASMLQDFEAGRQSEIDVINGAVVAAGDKHGVPTPINKTLLALIKGAEQARGLR